MAGNVAAERGVRIREGSRVAGRLQGILLALALLLTAVLGGLTWAQRSGWSLEQPEVLGISPPDGTRNVAGNAPLAIQFNMPMNQDSVRGNLKIDPPTDGSFGWQGNTMVFTPTVGYQRGVTYTVQVDAGASTPLFRALGTASSVSFRTAGLPSVYRSVPLPDTREVPTDTMVTIQFSQPMVPLAALDARPVSNSPDQVLISPAPDGKWQWLGTTTLAFRTAALAAATHYTVAVSQNFTDIAGGKLDRDYSFSFDTVRPGVIFVRPLPENKYAGLHDPIHIEFNQPVDHASAEAGFSMTPAAPLTFAWSEDSTIMTGTLSADLARGQQYSATIGGVKPLAGSGAGDLAMAQPYSWTFGVSPEAKAESSDPADGEGNVELGRQIIVRFTAPISATFDEMTAAVSAEPSVRGLQAYLFDENTALNIYAQLAPSTQYKFSVRGLKSSNGVAVPDYSWTFTTAPLPPSATAINTGHLVSFYAGAPTRAYIEAVNVDFVRLRVWRLSGDELIKFMSLRDEDQAQYQPNSDPLRVWDLQVDQTLDKRQALYPNLALDGSADRLPPGFYYLRVTSPQTIDGTAVIVGNTSITMKKSDSEVWAWAVDMRDGKPITDREIRVLNDGVEIGRATTDASGLVRLKGDLRQAYSLVALSESGDDVGLVSANWSDGIAPWAYGISSGASTTTINAAIYTERPIYRPGQTVYFKGVLRDDADGRYSIPQQKTVSISIGDPVGQQVYSATLPLSEFGSFNGEYHLPDYATLGSYYVSLSQNNQYFYGNFDVQEYRKPEYLVNVTTDKQDYVAGEQIKASAAATYFFGGPVAGAQVTTRVQSSDYYFSWNDPDTGEYYDFQDVYALPDQANNGVRSENTVTSDANGRVDWTIPADTNNRAYSQLVTVEASVMDSSNQVVANSTQLIVHAGQYYIGLHPDKYVSSAGQPVDAKVQLVGINKQKYGAANVKLSYYKRTWEQTIEKDENGLDRLTWKPKDTLLSGQEVSADANGVASGQFTPTEPGEYRIAAESRDSLGNTISSATYVYVTSEDIGASVSWNQKSPFAIDMVPDKKQYKPGDVARILVTSPFKDATALLTIERGSIIAYRVVQLQGNSPVLEIPIDDTFLPNVYLSLSVIAPNAADGGQPDFRQGWLALDVSADSRRLLVQVTPSSDKVHPGDTVTYTVKTLDADGNPTPAEVSLAVVDKAIFSLATSTNPTLMDQFYGNRPLGYNIASSMVALQAQIAAGIAAPGAKGGGGGGAEAAGYVRRQFEDSAFWQANVTTDATGSATVQVRLPDNLTTWRMTAIGVTKETQVGQGTSEVVASKDLLLRPVLPRFLLTGDQFTAGAIVHNYTTSTLNVSVTLAISGATLLDEDAATQTLTVAPGAEETANFDAEAGVGASADFTYTASTTGGPADAVAMTLPVQPSLVPETVATANEVAGDSAAQEQFFLPHGVDTRFGDLTVRVTPSLAASTASSLKFIEENDWESVEATVSRFLPLLQLNQAYAAALQNTPYAATLDTTVNRGLQKLYAAQMYDGGWSWWPDSGTSQVWMTAYALEGLSAARAAGYPVIDATIDNAANYLTTWLTGAPSEKGQTTAPAVSDDPGMLNTRAYVLYVLSIAGKGDVALERALAARASSLAVYGRAYLALAFGRSGAPDDAAALLKDMIALVKQTSTTAHWEETPGSPEYFRSMNTDTRTTALVLRVLLQQSKDDPLIPATVRWLMTARRDGHWLTNQESAAVVGALAQYLSTSSELGANYTWTAQLNNTTLGNATVSSPNNSEVELHRAVADLLINENNTLTLTRQGSGGQMYYDMTLNYYLPGQGLQARNEGLSIVREYTQPTSGKPNEAPVRVSSAKAGDLVEVHLTVIVPTDAYYLVVDDPLPAGLEAVNGTLNTTGLTAQLAQQSGKDKAGNPIWYSFDNVEMRDDSTQLFASFLPAGVYEYRYLARATTPGTFTALPARSYLAYQPDVWGRSDGTVLQVTK